MIEVGIIGTRWGLVHVGAFRAAGATVRALCGQDAARTRELAGRLQIPVATTSIEALCDACDLVVVASPDRLHAAHVRTAAARGKHVLCEKPLTCEEHDAVALAALAAERGARHGQIFAINFPYRLVPMLADLRAATAALSPAEWISVATLSSFAGHQGKGRSGPLMAASGDFGGISHFVDMALWLTGGAPRWVQAELVGRPAHTVALHLGLDTGATVALTHVATPRFGIHVRLTAVGGLAGAGVGWRDDPAGGDGAASDAGSGWEAHATLAFRQDAPGIWAESARLHTAGKTALLHARAARSAARASARLEDEPEAAFRDGVRDDWFDAHLRLARTLVQAVAQGGTPRGVVSFDEGATVQRVLCACMRSVVEARRIPL